MIFHIDLVLQAKKTHKDSNTPSALVDLGLAVVALVPREALARVLPDAVDALAVAARRRRALVDVGLAARAQCALDAYALESGPNTCY